jgi:hypothetical protein
MEKIPNLLCAGRTKNALLKALSSRTSEFRLFSRNLCFVYVAYSLCKVCGFSSFKDALVKKLSSAISLAPEENLHA